MVNGLCCVVQYFHDLAAFPFGDPRYRSVFHDDFTPRGHAENMLPVHQVGAVRAQESKRFKQLHELLEYLGADQFFIIAEEDGGIVAAGFEADDLVGTEIISPG